MDNLTFSNLQEAIAFAARAHHGQLRKDNKTPYVSHVFRVAMIVRDLFGFDDPRMLVAAVLHDTIEDTKMDFDDIEEGFGREIAEWVSMLTKNKSLPEAAREEEYVRRLLAAPWQVHACKLADVYDNLSDMDSLPAERRSHSLKRLEKYVAAIRGVAVAELKEPLRLVEEQLTRQRKKS
jgi:guanosine-3',5'-bis(diphosphate) 3'-pyrophosphohydrolase